jgi:hypothetical protein
MSTSKQVIEYYPFGQKKLEYTLINDKKMGSKLVGTTVIN